MKTDTAEDIIKLLDLKPLAEEGGFFKETYRSPEMIPGTALPVYYNGSRSLCTAIYYLLTPQCFSAIHKVASDEIFHFYLGDPVRMLLLYPDGKAGELEMGQDIGSNQQLQATVHKGVWQGAALQPGGKYALLGTTVSPGFEYSDFVLGERESLIKEFPEYKADIIRLTR
jgi:predicted cupin superfamily sugar epimerase